MKHEKSWTFEPGLNAARCIKFSLIITLFTFLECLQASVPRRSSAKRLTFITYGYNIKYQSVLPHIRPGLALINNLRSNINMHMHSQYCFSYNSYGTSRENLFKHRGISSRVIVTFILMTCTFDQTVLLLGGNHDAGHY